jgi:hypothetical protein
LMPWRGQLRLGPQQPGAGSRIQCPARREAGSGQHPDCVESGTRDEQRFLKGVNEGSNSREVILSRTRRPLEEQCLLYHSYTAYLISTMTRNVGRTRSVGDGGATPELITCGTIYTICSDYGEAEWDAASMRSLQRASESTENAQRVMNSTTWEEAPGCVNSTSSRPSGNRECQTMGLAWFAHKWVSLFQVSRTPVFEDGRRGRLDRLVCAVRKKRPRYSSLQAFLFDRRLYASSLEASQGRLVGWGAPAVGVGKSKHLPTSCSADGCLPCSLPRSCAPGFEWRR